MMKDFYNQNKTATLVVGLLVLGLALAAGADAMTDGSVVEQLSSDSHDAMEKESGDAMEKEGEAMEKETTTSEGDAMEKESGDAMEKEQ